MLVQTLRGSLQRWALGFRKQQSLYKHKMCLHFCRQKVYFCCQKFFGREGALLIPFSSFTFILSSLWCPRKDSWRGNLELSISVVLFQGVRSRPCSHHLFLHQKSIQGDVAQSEYHPPMLSIRLLVQMGTRGSQGQGEYRLPNARNPPFDNGEYQKRPQPRTEREKPLWTLPALNQPAIDFWQGSLNGLHSYL